MQAKSRFYEDLKDELLEEFEPEELLLKLIQKAYQEVSHTEFLPINRNKRSSRGRGGFRRGRRSGGGSRRRGSERGSDRKGKGRHERGRSRKRK